MAKVDQSRTDYLQHAEELAHFAQSWETKSTKQKSLGRETVNAVRESSYQRKETRSCHECGRVGHLRATCPDRKQRADLTLAVDEKVWRVRRRLDPGQRVQPPPRERRVAPRGR
ncbi:hypothetical protein PF010_g27811 [Phytophthora fragariae]|uniref:CCHC-type domain-containing protein n=1 Tax=Phytophthora fragariae TaxID=53985 RepID=A0A6A3DMD4_9STRA|nr:hypothetical protein PF003_g18441 [Phytophthora fragariae]KAE8920917.1 hypothetical protein PF009_g28795 [Phytophthora fragariae]KAE9066562.1 hypothetical protein PF010_g27811 [Phytophthora fragariae]KAE9067392.1 hypothetical protein PF007_g28092 [Phytophthora fragariae]KAE9077864.1 hypothetical protein PF006_g27837 [Phytophthora fragariae]